jgi:hypothetical protein
MRKGFCSVVIAACLCAPFALGHAQETPTAKPQPVAPVAKPVPPKGPAGKAAPAAPTSAAESRYRAWVDREHAKDAVDFQKDKSKIEDKYKGYVRPKRAKKGSKADKSPKTGE